MATGDINCGISEKQRRKKRTSLGMKKLQGSKEIGVQQSVCLYCNVVTAHEAESRKNVGGGIDDKVFGAHQS
jgi:hypothetical protein